MSGPVVRLVGVHARDRLGPGGRSRGRLHGLTITFEAGIHAVLGRPSDGTTALCELLTGRARPRAGTVAIAGRAPWRSPALRRRIGSCLARPTLPDVGRVSDLIALASRMRGVDAAARLHELGLGDLPGLRLRSLRPQQARALELALALAVPGPLALVLQDPVELTDLVDREALMEALRSAAEAGAAVVVTSSLPSDVDGLAEVVHLVERGRLTSSEGAVEGSLARRHELVVWLDDIGDARRLAAALSERDELEGVAWEGRADRPAVVWARAANLDAAAAAVTAAVVASGVELRGFQPVSPRLDALQEAARERLAATRAAEGGARG